MLDEYKYPFIKTPENELAYVYGPSAKLSDVISTDSDLLDQAKARISETLKVGKAKPYINLKKPVLLFYTALLTLAALNDEDTTLKYIKAEVDMFHKLMEKENEDDLIQLAKILGLKVNKCDKVSFTQTKTIIYLELCSDLIDYIKMSKGTEAKLSRQILIDGKVFFNKRSLSIILKRRLQTKFKEMIKPLKISLPKTLEDMIKEGKARRDPPCIANIKGKGKLSEEEERVLNVYLTNVGETTNGENIIIYSCSMMKEKGLCVSDCGVKNPLQLVFKRLNYDEKSLNYSDNRKNNEDVK
jgi:DNA primase large subunit